MKAPDVIFIQENDQSRTYGVNQDEGISGMHKYIRKDALSEWLEKRKSDSEKIISKTQSEMWEAANSGRLDIILSLFEKLNSM